MEQRNDELMHYGVLGMKWGVRKGNYAKTYSKGVKKLQKLEKKENKFYAKSARKAMKGTGVTELSRGYQQKASEKKAKAEGFKFKGQKFYKKMEKAFRNVPASELNPQDIEYMKRYANKIFYQ